MRLIKNPRLSAEIFAVPAAGPAGGQALGADDPDPAREAYARGLAEGGAAARAALGGELALAAADLRGAAAAIEAARGELLARTEAELVELALAIARRVIGTEVEAGCEVASGLARRVVERLKGAAVIQLLVHPEDLARVRESLAAARAELGELTLELEVSPAVGRGGVVARARGRTVDARLDAQLEAIAAGLGFEPELALPPARGGEA